MSRCNAEFPVFPHDQRAAKVQKNGRIYFRTYTPSFVSGAEPDHYLFDTIDELCQFLKVNFNYFTRFDLCYRDWSLKHNEWIVVGYPDDGSHWVIGFCENLENVTLDPSKYNIRFTNEKEEKDA